MLEPVQGEGGVLPATVSFLRELRALTNRHGLLMIVDEIQTGIGRTGTLFAYEHFARSDDEAPDILTLGKGLGGGRRNSPLPAAGRPPAASDAVARCGAR
jgi:acetylornithine/N-succinyldiaminopimelate aminotransferase